MEEIKFDASHIVLDKKGNWKTKEEEEWSEMMPVLPRRDMIQKFRETFLEVAREINEERGCDPNLGLEAFSSIQDEYNVTPYLTELLGWAQAQGVSGVEVFDAMEVKLPHFRHYFRKEFQGNEVPSEDYYGKPPAKLSVKKKLKNFCKDNWKTYLPPLIWLPKYKLAFLMWDIIAGITTGVFIVPQGVAYAALAGMPAEYGLYTSIMPVYIYALLGTSRQLAPGPFALVSILVGEALAKYAEPLTPEYIQLSFDLMLFTGLVLIVLGLCRLGFVVNFMSKPMLAGFVTAAGIVIQTSQLAKLFGLTGVERKSQWIATIIEFFKKVSTTHWPTLVTGLVSIGIGVVAKVLEAKGVMKTKTGKRIPAPYALVIVVIGILVSYLADFESLGIDVVGDVPSGFPPVSVPSFSSFPDLIVDAIIIALIVYLTSLSIAKKYEIGYRVDGNQELIALGGANLVGSFFSGFVAAGAMARTVVAASSGAKTNLYGIITGSIVVLIVMVATPVLYFLPQTCLAAVIIVAAYGLWNFGMIKTLWYLSKPDLLVFFFSMVATLFLGISLGLLLSIAMSALVVLYMSSRPHVAVLGRIQNSAVMRNVRRYPETTMVVPGVLLVRYDADVFFTNIRFIRDTIRELIECEPEPVKAIVLDFSPCNFLDYTGIVGLRELFTAMKKLEIEVCLCMITGPIRDVFETANFLENGLLKPENIFWDSYDAVQTIGKRIYDQDHPSEMVDPDLVDELEQKKHILRMSHRPRVFPDFEIEEEDVYENVEGNEDSEDGENSLRKTSTFFWRGKNE